MYKVLLCWRYLKTRYLALACITSVMLGVATLIVVNSVMSGFSTKLRDRLHRLCSDVVIESMTLDGFPDPASKMDAIRKDPFLADKIEAMTPTLETFAMLQYRWPNSGETITRQVRVIGIDLEGRSAIGGFKEFLLQHKDKPTFAVSEIEARNYLWRVQSLMRPTPADRLFPSPDGDPPPPIDVVSPVKVPYGAIVGNLIASFRVKDEEKPGEYKEYRTLHPGEPIILTTVSGVKPMPVYDTFLVVDYFKSEMSDYDQNCVFVPLEHLQHLRTMQDRVTSINIRLKNYHRDAIAVRDRLREMFPTQTTALSVKTWEEKQGTILAAIDIEKGILNVLLFLIIGVAGFGILAIFSMIVAEKTRDIGILKALGASNFGVMKIFLSYGFLLGLIGTLCGTGVGVWLTLNINPIEHWLSGITGQHIFDPSVYYFERIPTDIQVKPVLIVNLGALAIAVVFSVLPALRAAMLQPVRALRYE